MFGVAGRNRPTKGAVYRAFVMDRGAWSSKIVSIRNSASDAFASIGWSPRPRPVAPAATRGMCSPLGATSVTRSVERSGYTRLSRTSTCETVVNRASVMFTGSAKLVVTGMSAAVLAGKKALVSPKA